MPLTKWYLYGMVHDPVKCQTNCPRCGTEYEDAYAATLTCDVCACPFKVQAAPVVTLAAEEPS